MTFSNDKNGFYFVFLLNSSNRSKRGLKVFDLLQMSQSFHIEIIVRKIEEDIYLKCLHLVRCH